MCKFQPIRVVSLILFLKADRGNVGMIVEFLRQDHLEHKRGFRLYFLRLLYLGLFFY